MRPYKWWLKEQVKHQLYMPHYLPGKLVEFWHLFAEIVNIVLALPLLPLAPLFALLGWYRDRKTKENDCV